MKMVADQCFLLGSKEQSNPPVQPKNYLFHLFQKFAFASLFDGEREV